MNFYPIIHHFSHEHPLKRKNLQDQTTKTVTCSGCEFEASGWVYGCNTCNYFLHKPCSKMPEILNHPFDPDHTLLLFPNPVYPGGAFICDACREIGTGFSYHCTECQIDLHNLCAFLPTSVDHSSHHHTLDLWSGSPYKNEEFLCDICQDPGSKQWLYRCNSCQFDAHMSCALVDIQSQHTSKVQKRERQQLGKPQNTPTKSSEPIHRFASWSQSGMRSPWIQTQYSIPRTRDGVMGRYHYGRDPIPRFTHTTRDGVMGHVVKGMVDGMAQQAGMAVLQGFLGGFLGGF